MDEKFDKTLDIVKRLAKKHENYPDYLEGLEHSRGTRYWDYINLESLLGLQNPKTDFKDELIFITYHQICELYFKLIKHEINCLVSEKERKDIKNWEKRIPRCTNYFDLLCQSFSVMHSGMDREEFMKFRMALLPASGFQSLQYREIELYSTNLSNLIPEKHRKEYNEETVENLYDEIYWKEGGMIHGTNKKTSTLEEFENKYNPHIINLIKQRQFNNLNYLYNFLPEKTDELKIILKSFDKMVNINWKFSHLKAIQQQLLDDKGIAERTKTKSISKGNTGTGGTYWEKYLLPINQKIRFFPSLWSEAEIADWGSEVIEKEFVDTYISSYMKKHVESRKNRK